MGGNRIKEASNTLKNLINSLPINSYFNIIKFGSSCEMLFKESKLLNSNTKNKALKLCELLSANLGGTELYNCIKNILNQKIKINKYKRQIFVLTDGGISNQNEVLSMVSKSSSENRFFSFGI